MINIQNPDNNTLLRHTVEALSKFCQGEPQPPLDIVGASIPHLAKLLEVNDENVLVNALCALKYLSNSDDETRIRAVMNEDGVTTNVDKLLQHHEWEIAFSAGQIRDKFNSLPFVQRSPSNLRNDIGDVLTFETDGFEQLEHVYDEDKENVSVNQATSVSRNQKPDPIEVEKMPVALRTRRQKEKMGSKQEENGELAIDGDDKKVIIEVGMKVMKRSLYEKLGEIVSLPTNETSSYNEVLYDDRELERLEQEDIVKGLALYDSLFPKTCSKKRGRPRKSKPLDAAPKKRGRPRK